MKILADMGVSLNTVIMLRREGHDALHLREEGLGKLPDADILEKAAKEERTVITFDLDFGDILAATRKKMPSVIIFRLNNQTPDSVNPRLLNVLAKCHADLIEGTIVLVEEERYRVRKLPIGKIKK